MGQEDGRITCAPLALAQAYSSQAGLDQAKQFSFFGSEEETGGLQKYTYTAKAHP